MMMDLLPIIIKELISIELHRYDVASLNKEYTSSLFVDEVDDDEYMYICIRIYLPDGTYESYDLIHGKKYNYRDRSRYGCFSDITSRDLIYRGKLPKRYWYSNGSQIKY